MLVVITHSFTTLLYFSGETCSCNIAGARCTREIKPHQKKVVNFAYESFIPANVMMILQRCCIEQIIIL